MRLNNLFTKKNNRFYFLTGRKIKTISNQNLSNNLEFEEVCSLYNHIAEEERHFNQMELEYRKLASQWLLVTFSAIGIILGKDFDVPTGLTSWDLIILICVLSSVGIVSIFILDIKAYHGLLHEAFKAGIGLEMKYNTFLPPIRINMIIAARDGDIVNWIVLFYFFSISSLAIIANFSYYYSSLDFSPIIIHIVTVLGLVSLYYSMKIKPREIEGLEDYINSNV
jgi:hypothetical protein